MFWVQIILLLLCGILTVIMLTRDIIGVRNVQQWIKKYMIWTGPVELLKIGQYAFLLGALINLSDSTKITKDDGFSNFLAIIFLLLYIAFAVSILFIFTYYSIDIPYLKRS